ncbi:phosphate ABC transporter substrate-binding protein [Comamonadaceae bacterium OH2545_COT-014]|nr:phosphate ABC transporter substrate-binding protein [Comamonadaceae bacterium OH2545_COT-014]
MNKRFFRHALAFGALALLATGGMNAFGASRFVLGVSEGGASDLHQLNAQTKYQVIATLIEQATKTPVLVEERARLSDVAAGVQSGEFDFVLVRPADIAARALREHNYRFIVSGKPDSHCYVGVTKNSPVQKLADIQGKRIATLQGKKPYLVRFCAADLRDNGISLFAQKIQEVGMQGAVAVSVGAGMADVALLEVNGAKAWQKQGHRIIHTSASKPYFPLVAGPRVTPEQVEAVRKAMLAAGNTASGQEAFKRLGIERMDTDMEDSLRQLLPWLEGKGGK